MEIQITGEDKKEKRKNKGAIEKEKEPEEDGRNVKQWCT